jgi:hypothetical protein
MTVKIDAMSMGSHAPLKHDFLVQLRARTSIGLARDSVHDSGYYTSRGSADRTCQLSVWIWKEQAFRLLCRMVLPFTLSKK